MRVIQTLDIPQQLPTIPHDNNIITETYTFRLETPMMGGGIEAPEVCVSEPVRVPSVRGNLREWWRVFRANGITGNELRESESALWGMASKNFTKPSSVNIRVKCAEVDEDNGMRYYDEDFGFARYGPESYALFPVATDKDGNGHDIAMEGLKFSVTLTYPATAKDDIHMAIAGWVNFGGIGSRTRRGLGTLSCSEDLPGIDALREAHHGMRIFTMNGARNGTALGAWRLALEAYRDFRQQRTNAGKNHPGRSYFPEPDSLRHITGRHSHRHPIIMPPDVLPSFPRAVLGLPVVFHFKDHGEPDTVLLRGKRPGEAKAFERMSSPVITKALRVNGVWCPSIIIMPNEEALNVKPVPFFAGGGGEINAPEMKPIKDDSYATLPHDPMNGHDNALDGLIHYITHTKTFREI